MKIKQENFLRNWGEEGKQSADTGKASNSSDTSLVLRLDQALTLLKQPCCSTIFTSASCCSHTPFQRKSWPRMQSWMFCFPLQHAGTCWKVNVLVPRGQWRRQNRSQASSEAKQLLLRNFHLYLAKGRHAKQIWVQDPPPWGGNQTRFPREQPGNSLYSLHAVWTMIRSSEQGIIFLHCRVPSAGVLTLSPLELLRNEHKATSSPLPNRPLHSGSGRGGNNLESHWPSKKSEVSWSPLVDPPWPYLSAATTLFWRP